MILQDLTLENVVYVGNWLRRGVLCCLSLSLCQYLKVTVLSNLLKNIINDKQ